MMMTIFENKLKNEDVIIIIENEINIHVQISFF